MKKRVIAVLTAVLMTASLAGCGSGKLSNDYVTVNKYKGLEVTEVAKNEVSDDSVEQEIQSRLEAAAPEQAGPDRQAETGICSSAKAVSEHISTAIPPTPVIQTWHAASVQPLRRVS